MLYTIMDRQVFALRFVFGRQYRMHNFMLCDHPILLYQRVRRRHLSFFIIHPPYHSLSQYDPTVVLSASPLTGRRHVTVSCDRLSPSRKDGKPQQQQQVSTADSSSTGGAPSTSATIHLSQSVLDTAPTPNIPFRHTCTIRESHGRSIFGVAFNSINRSRSSDPLLFATVAAHYVSASTEIRHIRTYYHSFRIPAK